MIRSKFRLERRPEKAQVIKEYATRQSLREMASLMVRRTTSELETAGSLFDKPTKDTFKPVFEQMMEGSFMLRLFSDGVSIRYLKDDYRLGAVQHKFLFPDGLEPQYERVRVNIDKQKLYGAPKTVNGFQEISRDFSLRPEVRQIEPHVFGAVALEWSPNDIVGYKLFQIEDHPVPTTVSYGGLLTPNMNRAQMMARVAAAGSLNG